MRKLAYHFCFLISFQVFAQPETDVYLLSIKDTAGKLQFENVKNISDNAGYDNQPSFIDSNLLLYSSTRDGQTDIMVYDLNTAEKKWLTSTPNGSEYSPLKIPGKNGISAIRLDKDGTQLLYQYDLESGDSEILLEDLKVGYHVWYNSNVLVTTVLIENRMDLVIANLSDGSTNTYQKNVGRSLLKIPGTELISYISKESKPWVLRSLNPVTGATSDIIALPNDSEDVLWLPGGTLLTASGNTLARFDPKTDQSWVTIHQFKDLSLGKLSRMAVDPKQRYLALVSEVSPVAVVQKQLDAYNARDIDAFMETYSDDIKLFNFPNQLSQEGKEGMREGYGKFFQNTPDLHCEIKNRIVIGNKVIDEEYLTVNGGNFSAVAIYEVENGKIVKVTFLR
ncbi:MAG: nuclear transport factor 2 family protein [Flavobacteriaceae bacterium]